MVMHWNTVITEKIMLSKLIIPYAGPFQPSLQNDPLGQCLPDSFTELQGAGLSSKVSFTEN